MRRPSPRCTPNTVTPLPRTGYSRDAAGGRVPVEGTPGEPIRCSMQPSSAEDLPDHLRDQGATYWTGYFHDGDPGLRLQDRVDFGGSTLSVKAGRDQAGRGRTFVVIFEERKP